MHKPPGALVVVLAALGGCSSESRVYRDRTLVAKGETGMSKDQVHKEKPRRTRASSVLFV